MRSAGAPACTSGAVAVIEIEPSAMANRLEKRSGRLLTSCGFLRKSASDLLVSLRARGDVPGGSAARTDHNRTGIWGWAKKPKCLKWLIPQLRRMPHRLKQKRSRH